MEMVGAILFAVLLYVITTELSFFVARRRARAVLRRTTAGGKRRPVTKLLQPVLIGINAPTLVAS